MKKIFMKKNLFLVTLFVLACSCFLVGFVPVRAAENVKPSEIFVAGEGVIEFSEAQKTDASDGSVDYTGLLVKTNGPKAEFSYKHKIDARTLSKDDALIDMQFLGLGPKNYGKASTAFLYLTDANDPSNRIGVGFYPANDLGEADNGAVTYFRVLYNGRSYGYDKGRDKIWVDEYGVGVYFRKLYPGKFLKNADAQPITLFFDYEEKSFYIQTQDGVTLILDLDDEKYIGDTPWKGFESDSCYLSMEIDYEEIRDGGVLIGELLGKKTDGTVLDLEENIPYAKIRAPKGYTVENLPKAEKGTAYRLPELDVFDFVYGKTDVVISARRNGQDVSDEIVDGALVAKETGVVDILYKAVNENGNSATDETSVVVVDKLPPYIYSKSSDALPKIGEYFNVPTITVMGGSGTLEINETVSFNGKILDLSKNRSVYIDRVGAVVVSLEVSGYTGHKESTNFVFAVDDGNTNIVVDSLPLSVKHGETFSVPEFTVYTSEGIGGSKKVYVNDTDVTNTMSYTVNEEAGDTLFVRFCGGEEEQYAEATFEVKVIGTGNNLSDYIYVTEGNGTVTDSYTDSAVIIESLDDTVSRFAYPMSMYNLKCMFAIDGSSADSLDIVLTGYENPSESIFFRISYLSVAASSLTVNGEGKEFVLPVSFARLSDYELTIQNNDGSVYWNDEKIADFNPIFSSGAIVEFRLNGVTSATKLYVKEMSNQSFNPNGFVMGDLNAPYVYIEEVISKYRQITSFGALLKLPKAKAFDVLSNGAEVKLLVVAPSKKTVYDGEIKDDCLIKIDEYGMYAISYVTTDAKGNTTRFTYNVEVIDKVSPTISVYGKPNETYKVGDTMRVLQYEVKDNFDENLVVEIFLKNNTTAQIFLIDGDDYLLTSKGSYTVIYRVRDAAYNVSRVEFQFEVVE